MSSPSEFLTFYRRAATSTPRMLRSVQRPAARSFTISSRCRKESDGKARPKEHMVDKAKKGNDWDVHSESGKKGMDAHKKGDGGHATERKDSAGGAKKAKEEFPEAPDTIGMQDERGARGH